MSFATRHRWRLTDCIALSHEAAVVLTQSIVDRFPTTAEDFSGSCSSQILLHLSQYFWALNYPVDGLKERYRVVELASACLLAITQLQFGGCAAVEADELDAFFGKTVRKKSQRERKKCRRDGRENAVDRRHFDNLGEEVPQTKDAAKDLARSLLEDQKSILEVSLSPFFHSMRRSDETLYFSTTSRYCANQS